MNKNKFSRPRLEPPRTPVPGVLAALLRVPSCLHPVPMMLIPNNAVPGIGAATIPDSASQTREGTGRRSAWFGPCHITEPFRAKPTVQLLHAY